MFKNLHLERENSATCKFYKADGSHNGFKNLLIEVSECYPDNTKKNSLPNLWEKAGHTNKIYDSYYHVSTCVDCPDGMSRQKFNPTIKEGGAGYVINFDWLLEVKPGNLEKIFSEILRQANA